MKLHYILIIAFIAACAKEDPAPVDTADPEIVHNQVTDDLADQDNLTEFTEAFNDLEMSSNDVAEGITIFAPIDNNSSNGRKASDTTTLTSEILKDHIVKGVLETISLNDGDTLVTLNGKQVIVTIDGQDIRVNGVLLSGKNIATKEKYVVHTVEQIINRTSAQDTPGTIEVTVWNGTKWAPEHLQGEVEAGATVSLYNSHADFIQNKPAAYTAETKADGKVTFTNIDPSKVYYVSAMKELPDGTIDNVFYEESQDTVYVGLVPEGIFQNQEEADSYAQIQPGAQLGNFRWKDMNADGLISAVDKVSLPYQEVNAISGETVQEDVMIGYNNNRDMSPVIMNEEEALQTLNEIYLNLNRWQEFLVMTDGMLSDDDVACNMPDWCALDNFSFAANHPIITNVWQGAYDNIGRLNLLLRDVPGLSFTEKEQIVAEAKGLRAHIYLQLVTYFGDVPLQSGLILESDVARIPAEEIYASVSNDLSEAAGILPSQWTSAEGLHRFNADAAKVLLAKAALRQQQWAAAAAYTDEILASARYTLMGTGTEVFASHDNGETIWNHIALTELSAMFSNYFVRGPYFPSARLAEVYLINAESKNEITGPTPEVYEALDPIRAREGMSAATASTQAEMREVIKATWKGVMPHEGNRFANLVRWEMAQEVLGPKGYLFHHALLPVPQLFIDQHPNMIQNPGY